LLVCGSLVEGGILLRASGPTLALRKAIAFAVHFENVDVMGQAIEQGAGEPLGERALDRGARRLVARRR
jgi:hypothetical protein